MAVFLVGRKNAAKDELPRIIEARTASSAIAHAARTEYGAAPVSFKEAMTWAEKGVKLETAGEAEIAEQPPADSE